MDKPPRIPPAEAYRSPEGTDFASQCAEIATQMVYLDRLYAIDPRPHQTLSYLHTDSFEPKTDVESLGENDPVRVRVRQTVTVGADFALTIKDRERGNYTATNDTYRVFSLQVGDALNHEQDSSEDPDWHDLVAIIIKPEEDDTIGVDIVRHENGRSLDDSELTDLLVLLSILQEQQRRRIFKDVVDGNDMPYPEINPT